MRLDEEKQQEQQVQFQDMDVANHRWMWVRRFILCIILITISMQSLAPIYFEEQPQEILVIKQGQTQPKSHTVLHTGFPPTEKLQGLPIYAGKSAATAFSPNPASSSTINCMTTKGGESWWDRLFPNRHVHLLNVQLPIIPLTVNATSAEAQLSICTSKREKLGLGRALPDMSKCIETSLVNTGDIDPLDNFGVLEWEPKDTIVLQKSKVYWLVVQTPEKPFTWVYSESGTNEHGTAYETEAGWEVKLEGEPIPSIIIAVEDHH